MRVYAAADTPVIVSAIGAIHVRTAKGKQPLGDHRSLLELSRRGELAREAAFDRIRRWQLLERAGKDAAPSMPGIALWEVEVRLAPFTVIPAFTDWLLASGSRAALERVGSHLRELVGQQARPEPDSSTSRPKAWRGASPEDAKSAEL